MPTILRVDGLALDGDMQLGALQEGCDLTDEQVDQRLTILLVTEFGEPIMRGGLDGVHCKLETLVYLLYTIRIHSRLLSVSLTVTTVLKGKNV